jgi:hypothetical protein
MRKIYRSSEEEEKRDDENPIYLCCTGTLALGSGEGIKNKGNVQGKGVPCYPGTSVIFG